MKSLRFALVAAISFFASTLPGSTNLVPVQAPKPTKPSRDWPMLGGTPQRNMVNVVDKNVPVKWDIEKGTNVKWSVQLGRTSWSGPVIGDGKIFVGTNNERPRNPQIKGDKGIVMCFREGDGKFLWQAVHDKFSNQNCILLPQGVASTPCVDGKRLFYVSSRCELICADTEGFLDNRNDGVQDEKHKSKLDADIVWRLDMSKELKVAPTYLPMSSPIVVGDRLFVCTGHSADPVRKRVIDPKSPSFVAVDKMTGAILWMDNSPGDQIMEGEWGSPTYAVVNGKPQVIFAGGDGWLYAFKPSNGIPIWKFDCNPKDAVWNPRNPGISTRGYPFTPVVHDNRVYVSIGRNPRDGPGIGHLWCVDLTKRGDVSAEIETLQRDGTTKIEKNPNSGVIWHYGGVNPTAEKDGKNWIFGRSLSSCAIHDGLLYAAEYNGYFHCLEAKTGKVHWVHDLITSVYASPYVVDLNVYLGTEDGEVLVFAHGARERLLARMDMKFPCRGPVVVARGVLYVRTDEYLHAIAFPQKQKE